MGRGVIRYIVDISPETTDIINIFIQKGEYRTVQEFITTSIRNQIYLSTQPDTHFSTIESSQLTIRKKIDETKPELTSSLDLKDYAVEVHDSKNIKSKYTLSGFWNKFLPVKITLRVLASMQNEKKEPVLLDFLQENASNEARRLGQVLVRKEKGSGRKRGDRLFTGLPVKRNSEKSRLRFKTHFVGSLSRGKIDGMPGTLGLIHIFKGNNGKDYVSITEQGLQFTKIPNSIIDKNDFSSPLSEEEKKFLVEEIRSQLPNEYDSIISVLKLIEDGNTETKSLLSELERTYPDWSKNKLTVFLTGMLNRIADLGLVRRTFDSLSFKYEVSENSKIIIYGSAGEG